MTRGAAWITGALDRYSSMAPSTAWPTLSSASGRALRRVQTGRVNNYVLGVAVGIVLLVVLTSWL